MSSLGGLLITLSCLSPGIGVFIVGSDVIHQVGSGAFLCFVAAVVLGIAMAAVYAELGSAFPDTGGEYTITGRLLGPPAGFAILANNLLGFCIALALSGYGVADYLNAALGGGLTPWPIALAAIASVTLIGVLSIKVNAWVTGLFLAAEMAALLLTAVLGLAHAQPDALHRIVHPMTSAGGALHGVPIAAMGVAAAGGIYAFNGYGSVVVLGEEIRDARRGVAAVVYWALAIAAVAELLPMLGVIVGAPDLAALSASASPVPDFLRTVGGPVLARLMSLAVALAIFNAMIGTALMGGRQIYATARDRCWSESVSATLDRVHPRFGSPWTATLLLGGIGAMCSLLPVNLLVTILGNGNVALYALLCLAVIAGRRSGGTAGTHARMPFYPLAPLFVLLALCGVIWADLLDSQTGRVGLLATALILALGAGYYGAALRSSRSWGHRDPGT